MTTTETELERQVREEQEAHDAENDGSGSDPTDEATKPEADPEPGAQAAAFDVDDYADPALSIHKVDGHQIDRIALTFSGTVFLERGDAEDVALYNRLKLGRDVTLQVEAKTSGSGAKGATDKDGDLDVVVGEKKLKVHSVYIPAGG